MWEPRFLRLIRREYTDLTTAKRLMGSGVGLGWDGLGLGGGGGGILLAIDATIRDSER